jgi:hypothetical protein
MDVRTTLDQAIPDRMMPAQITLDQTTLDQVGQTIRLRRNPGQRVRTTAALHPTIAQFPSRAIVPHLLPRTGAKQHRLMSGKRRHRDLNRGPHLRLKASRGQKPDLPRNVSRNGQLGPKSHVEVRMTTETGTTKTTKTRSNSGNRNDIIWF